MPLLQQKNSAGDVEEIGVGDLEKFVARKCLQDLDERLAVVAARIEPRFVERALEFQSQHRDLGHAAAVCRRCEEAEEAVLANEIAFVVVTLDADAIHRHGAMNRAARVRLGDDQQVLAAGECAELG